MRDELSIILEELDGLKTLIASTYGDRVRKSRSQLPPPPPPPSIEDEDEEEEERDW
jgi:hypothetical protein